MAFFTQLFDPETSTLTYIIGDEHSGKAVVIDPVYEQQDRDRQVLEQHGLDLEYVLETHVHADHVTSGHGLKTVYDARFVVGENAGIDCADINAKDGQELVFGNEVIRVIATPGHTDGCVSYLWRDRVFTGDALLIDGCGRTDFQQGDAGKLYDSITQKLFPLGDDVLVYPGHDYNHRRVSSIGQEKLRNPRLAGKSKEEFAEIMNNLDLPYPKKIDVAVPANKVCGARFAS